MNLKFSNIQKELTQANDSTIQKIFKSQLFITSYRAQKIVKKKNSDSSEVEGTFNLKLNPGLPNFEKVI
jgi:hypothetical protein